MTRYNNVIGLTVEQAADVLTELGKDYKVLSEDGNLNCGILRDPRYLKHKVKLRVLQGKVTEAYI